MPELTFRDGIMDRIRLKERRYDERAYLFVLAALEYCQQKLPERRHITGQELDQVMQDADRDRWFTAEQALEYGFIDKVITSAREAADEGRPARKD